MSVNHEQIASLFERVTIDEFRILQVASAAQFGSPVNQEVVGMFPPPEEPTQNGYRVRLAISYENGEWFLLVWVMGIEQGYYLPVVAEVHAANGLVHVDPPRNISSDLPYIGLPSADALIGARMKYMH